MNYRKAIMQFNCIKKVYFLIFFMFLSLHNAFAENYPTRPIKMVVPFPPGGSVDYIARIVAPKLAIEIGQPVVIENKGGVGGVIGTSEVAKAAPDGYTLLLVFDTHAVNQYLYKLPYDTFSSFDYITELASSPMILVVPKTSPFNSINEFISGAKTRSNGVTYGSSGVGSSNHLSCLDFAQKVGINATHIPYKGGGPMLTAAMAGEVDFIVTSMPVILGQIKSGESKLKALGVSTNYRVGQLPDLPTIASVVSNYSAESWVGVVAPVGLSVQIKNRITEAFKRTLALPEVKDRLTADGFHVANVSSQQFIEKVRRESKRVGTFIKKNDIQID
jgi:tripartite-type tricarboxylate transporter receptor subunit TctC